MHEPVFTETMQIGIVVRDLRRRCARTSTTTGSGRGTFTSSTPGMRKGLRECGRPVERSWRLAVTMVGQVMWQLIEPLDGESVYARFLAEKGEGVHHIAVRAL